MNNKISIDKNNSLILLFLINGFLYLCNVIDRTEFQKNLDNV